MSKPLKQIQEIGIGLAIGILATLTGIGLYILLFSPFNVNTTLSLAKGNGHLGSIIGLGALLNLLAFFRFLKINREARAKGVLLATFLVAIIILLLKML